MTNSNEQRTICNQLILIMQEVINQSKKLLVGISKQIFKSSLFFAFRYLQFFNLIFHDLEIKENNIILKFPFTTIFSNV